MNEVLTMAEIEARYPKEWVLLSDLETNERQQVVRARLVFHSPDRDEVDRQALLLPIPRHIAIFYTGPIPEDVEFLPWL
jgi:hypothetical protein